MRMYVNGGRFNLRVFILIMASLFVWNISCVYYTVNKLLLGWNVGVECCIIRPNHPRRQSQTQSRHQTVLCSATDRVHSQELTCHPRLLYEESELVRRPSTKQGRQHQDFGDV